MWQVGYEVGPIFLPLILDLFLYGIAFIDFDIMN